MTSTLSLVGALRIVFFTACAAGISELVADEGVWTVEQPGFAVMLIVLSYFSEIVKLIASSPENRSESLEEWFSTV